MILEAADNGSGLSKEEVNSVSKIMRGELGEKKSGGALRNIYKRMKLSFGDGFEMKVASELGVFTTVTLIVPEKANFLLPDVRGDIVQCTV
jgi:two-component system sensor histidine kinase YesM